MENIITFSAKRLVEADAFLEWADVHGARYGSPRAPIDRALSEGRDVLFDIDWQGARDIAQKCPQDAVRVFILPPSRGAAPPTGRPGQDSRNHRQTHAQKLG